MNREFGFFILRAANTNCFEFAIKKLLQIVARVFRFDLSTVHQLGKRGIGIFQQFGWRVEFDQLATAHHHHPVRIHYGFQPMGDGQHRRLTKCRSDCFLNQTVRLCIDTGRRFVNTNHLEILMNKFNFIFNSKMWQRWFIFTCELSNKARARHNNCFWPTENILPRSRTSVDKPFAHLAMVSLKWQRCSDCHNCVSE